MHGHRLEKTGGVLLEYGEDFFLAENDADASRSFAAVEWHDSGRFLDEGDATYACEAQPETFNLTHNLFP